MLSGDIEICPGLKPSKIAESDALLKAKGFIFSTEM